MLRNVLKQYNYAFDLTSEHFWKFFYLLLANIDSIDLEWLSIIIKIISAALVALSASHPPKTHLLQLNLQKES